MDTVDICLVSTGDNEIPLIADELISSPALRPGTIVFHCSGATPSSIFSALRGRGALIASVHPVKTLPLRWKMQVHSPIHGAA
ncbi:hypothetical protein [Granulicella sibirica]|uniref:hypothetical protein n=1 Tax=Granulicella sibirica TaxID=2479048 RepID=UPI0010092E1D